MKIIVTGGAGYIGSHVCKVLAAKGFEPVVFDNLSRGNRRAVKWGPLEVGDIADSARLRGVLEQYRSESVMHFAGCAHGGEAGDNALLYYSNKVACTAALMQTIIDFQAIPFVFSSRCSTYGVPEVIPIPEDHP